ncbi:hypothetical protein [Variovorax paradoxus]|uniref:hypothetical protein n=2 Tax=Bacteria TaxID=2 RepID=UPI001ABCC4CD
MSTSGRHFSDCFTPLWGGAMLFARWLLVLIIAVDLIGSPFHAHHHDGGPEGYASQVGELSHGHASLDQPTADDGSQSHVHTDAAGEPGGHSMSALRGLGTQVVEPSSVPELLALVPVFALLGLLALSVSQALVRWRQAPERVRIPFFRTVPPDGRAPPFLHG